MGNICFCITALYINNTIKKPSKKLKSLLTTLSLCLFGSDFVSFSERDNQKPQTLLECLTKMSEIGLVMVIIIIIMRLCGGGGVLTFAIL